MSERKMHPNSLANLMPSTAFKDSDIARAAQKKATEARMRNKAIREQLKVTAGEWKSYAEIKDEVPKAVDIMRILMMKALENEDYDLAGEYANKIAAYETPKLSSVEATNLEVSTEDLSDEELNARIKQWYSSKEGQKED